MKTVASRDLRNHTADVLRHVVNGEVVAVTVHGKVVAELVPPRSAKPRAIPKARLLEMLALTRPDPDLVDLLDELTSETTEDL